MHLALEHLRGEMSRQCGLLVTWGLLLFIRILVKAQELGLDFYQVGIGETSQLLLGPLCLFWIFLVARLLQPISPAEPDPTGKEWFIGKALFWFLLLFLPSLIPAMMDLVAMSPGTNAVAQVLWGYFVWQFCGIACIAWLSVYLRWLPLVLLALFLLGVVGIFLYVYLDTEWRLRGSRDPIYQLVLDTHKGLYVGPLLIGWLGGLALATLARFRWLGMTMGVVGLLLSITIIYAGPWGLPLFSSVEVVSPNPLPVRHVTFSPEEEAGWGPYPPGWNLTYNAVYLRLIPQGLTDDALPAVDNIKASFQGVGGAEVLLPYGSGYGPDTELELLEKEEPGLTITPAYARSPARQSIFSWREDALKLQGQTGTLTLKIRGRMLALRKRMEMPLALQRWERFPGAFIRAIPLNSTLYVTELSYRRKSAPQRTLCLVVDRSRRTAVVMARESEGPIEEEDQFGPWLKKQQWYDTSLSDYRGRNLLNLDASALCVYTCETGSRFEATVTIPNFSMEPRP